jgi:SAM-dependent methyltransferase
MRDRSMPTFEELLLPLPFYSPRGWYYALASFFLRSIGLSSEGIKIAYKHGFDSGMIMNYIYNNVPSGRFYVGELIDRAFLNQVTCKAFRAIKDIQKNMIKDYIQERDGNPAFVVDLASGKADYVYEVLREVDAPVKALLRDIDQRALAESKENAKKFGLEDIVSYEVADALDSESLKRINPRPSLVIEVGLYGIIHNDALIRSHFKDLKNILNPDAVLFNVQTFNPQIELIARALKNQAGERCVWHLRSADLVIDWAEEAGFANPNVVMDPYRIYAVVMMRNDK